MNTLSVAVALGRLRAKLEANFKFGKEWMGKIYEEKKIRVIYTEEEDNIVVITVYVFYGEWKREVKK